MTTENANPIEVTTPTPEVQNTEPVIQKEQEASSEMSTQEIHELSDAELDKKLAGDPPAPKVEKPKEDTEVEKIRKQLADKEAFIQRQAQELGQLRKIQQPTQQQLPPAIQQAIPEAPKMSADELTALMLEDPRKAMQVLESERQSAEAIRRAEMAERSRILKSIAPDLEDNAATIAKIMKEEDGLTDEQILNIAQNIDKVPQDILYNYNQRAKVARKIAEYEAKIKELEGKPARILNKIEAAQKPHMTSSSGQSNPLGSTTNKSAENMSDTELNEALKRSGII